MLSLVVIPARVRQKGEKYSAFFPLFEFFPSQQGFRSSANAATVSPGSSECPKGRTPYARAETGNARNVNHCVQLDTRSRVTLPVRRSCTALTLCEVCFGIIRGYPVHYDRTVANREDDCQKGHYEILAGRLTS